MRKTRIGEVLCKMVRLSEMDIEEILQEQHVGGQRFGEIAVSWGLCEPKHVWDAWFQQLSGQMPRIDLDEVGVDVQALAFVPRSIALEYNLIPMRVFGDQMVVAVPHDSAKIPAEIFDRCHKNVRFVCADAGQIRRAIDSAYGDLRVSA